MVSPKTYRRYWVLGILALLSACDNWFGKSPESISPTLSWQNLPGWEHDKQEQAWSALLRNCQAMLKKPDQTDWHAVCQLAQTTNTPDRATAKAFFEQYFTPKRLTGAEGKTTGFMTGYYEPLLMGSLTPDERFKYPLYSTPSNLLTLDFGDLYPELKGKRVRGRLEGQRVVPFYDRAKIEGISQPLKGHELLWVDNREDLFFLHIQGSGRVQLPDGQIVGVGYDNQNGHPYVAIGKILIDRGIVERQHMNMFTLKDWLRNNPSQAEAILNENPSYVFFNLRHNVADGPLGSLNVPLVTERSIAVDPTTIPLGSLLWVDSHYPNSQTPLQKLVFAQDTGGAIKGELRADFFFGNGHQAEQWAGRMKQDTQFYQLIPKTSGQ